MLSFKSALLNLLDSIQVYQNSSLWKCDVEKERLYQIQRELQQTLAEFQAFSSHYEPQHDTWRECLHKEVKQLRNDSESLPPRTQSRSENQWSGRKKSLLKLQLTQTVDPLKSMVLNLVSGAERSLERLAALAPLEPQMQKVEFEDGLCLDRLVEICRNEREHYLNMSGNFEMEFDPHATWIIDFNTALTQMRRSLDQAVYLMRKYEEKIDQTNEKERTRSSISCYKKLDYGDTPIRQPKSSNPSAREITFRHEPESCIRCCIF